MNIAKGQDPGLRVYTYLHKLDMHCRGLSCLRTYL